jgi:hypothetical protein
VDPDEYPLEFVAHALIGGPTALAVHLTRGIAPEGPVPLLDVGRLYCGVAGLLNLVAICDAVGAILDARESVAETARAEALREPAREQGPVAPLGDGDPEREEDPTPLLPWPGDLPPAVPGEPR